MTIYDRIRRRREELGMSQQDLADKLGYKSRSAINKIEQGVRDISQSRVIAFANALHTTPAYLMGWTDEINDRLEFDNLFPIETKKFPLLGEIACGKPVLANETLESYIEVGTNIRADFCLRCKGDSMINARIYDGDIVFIREQPTVNNGEIAAVIINDEATLKRVYYYQEESKLILNAENPKYAPFVYMGNELNQVRILGKAIAFQSDVR